MYSSVEATFFHRTPSRVECAPQPNPSHSPSCQYFRLCRDSRPGRATFEISYCSIAGPIQPLQAPQIHLRRVVVGRQRPAGARHVFLQRRVRDRARADRATRARAPRRSARRRSRASPRRSAAAATSSGRARCCRSRRARASRTAPRARGRPNECRPSRFSSSSRNDCTPKLSRLTPASRNPAIRSGVDVSGLVFERDFGVRRRRRTRRGTRAMMRAISCGLEERRRAAAEEDRVGRLARDPAAAISALERLDVAVLQRRRRTGRD